jgi:uncharacterized repeat protein (TIGR03803 family)
MMSFAEVNYVKKAHPMKNHFKNPILLAVVPGLMLVSQTMGQTFTTLHSFTVRSGSASTNSDGADPYSTLVLAGNTLYGTTQYGGIAGNGTVFAINTNGSDFTNLYSFSLRSGSASTNRDGANPYAGLILFSNTLYGTTQNGGRSGKGTLFAISTSGQEFTNLYNFTGGNDGANPRASLIFSNNILYGTAEYGGSANYGTVFKVGTNGQNFTTLHTFTNAPDGALPVAKLFLSGNTLYGTAYYGGTHGYGTIFKVNTDASGFTNIYQFTGLSDGAVPDGGVILSGNILYGTAHNGDGNMNQGEVFQVNIDGSGFETVHGFTNSTGANHAYAGLILAGNTLYGTSEQGGSLGDGTVFAVNTDGSGYSNLYSFTDGNDGYNPDGGLVLFGNTLYGTSDYGGSTGNGTVFSLTLVVVPTNPQLAIALSGTNVILSWPAPTTGYVLQATTNLVSPAWTSISGQYTVTNPIVSNQKFYRLILP